MNRIIKFRCWDKELSKIYPVKTIYWKDEDFEVVLYDETHRIKEDIEIMQYTGLKDKNGKEIYEGDILKSVDGKISVIEYEAPHFIVRHKPENGSDFIAVKNYFEIIGNIYENPELLK